MTGNFFSGLIKFNKIPLFSKDLITFIISFISLFIKVIPAPKTLSEAFFKLLKYF